MNDYNELRAALAAGPSVEWEGEGVYSAAFMLAASPATIAALFAERDATREDAARLDWIDSQWRNGVHVEACAKGDGTTWHALRRECNVYSAGEHSADNVRAAIDAARNKPPSPI